MYGIYILTCIYTYHTRICTHHIIQKSKSMRDAWGGRACASNCIVCHVASYIYVCIYIHIYCIYSCIYIYTDHELHPSKYLKRMRRAGLCEELYYIHICILYEYMYLHAFKSYMHIYIYAYTYHTIHQSKCSRRMNVGMYIHISYIYTYTHITYSHDTPVEVFETHECMYIHSYVVYIYLYISHNHTIHQSKCSRHMNVGIYIHISYIYTCTYITSSHDTPVEVFETHECMYIHTYIVYIYSYTCHVITRYSSRSVRDAWGRRARASGVSQFRTCWCWCVWVSSHIWMSHVTHEWVMSVSHTDDLCHSYQRSQYVAVCCSVLQCVAVCCSVSHIRT